MVPGSALPVKFSGIPQELRDCPQWILWQQVQQDGKLRKLPLSLDGSATIDPTDPSCWSTFRQVQTAHKQKQLGSGIGFCFSADDPFCGIDLDHCVRTGRVQSWTAEQKQQLPTGFPDPSRIVELLATYTEKSPSGSGLKLICKGPLPGPGRKLGPFEVYDRKRFFALTGQVLGKRSEVCEADQGQLEFLYSQLPERSTTGASELDWQTTKRPDGVTDKRILAELRKDLGALQLWNGNLFGYGSQSEADLALASHLVYFAGPYPAIVDRLFRQSELFRDKWDSQRGESTYGQETIGRAIAGKSQLFDWTKKVRTSAVIPDSFQSYQPFPVSALPGDLAEYVRQSATSIGVEAGMVAVPLLPVLAGLIGQSRTVRIKPQWEEPSILWTGVICGVGDAKSPSMDAALLLAESAKSRIQQENRQAQAQYKQDFADWKADKDGIQPVKPLVRQLLVQNVTLEALQRRLSCNWKGLIYARDELAAWIRDFNRYRSGSDVESWLTLHGGKSEARDRLTDDEHLDQFPCALSLCGTIQPVVAKKVLLSDSTTENGLAARLLVANPVFRWQPDTGEDAAVDPQLLRGVRQLGLRLYDLPAQELPDGSQRAVPLDLTQDAQDLLRDYRNRTRSEGLDLQEPLAGAWKKLNVQAARTALVLSVCRQLQEDPQSPGTGPVELSDVQAALLVADYFAHEQRRFYGVLEEDEQDTEDRQLLNWIRTKFGGQITHRQLQQGRREITTSKDAVAVLKQLEQQRLGSIRKKTGRGRQITYRFTCFE